MATLALSIGASLTMFGLLRTVLWRALPYPEAERIVSIRVDARNIVDTGATPGEIFDLDRFSRTLEQVSTVDENDVDLEYQGDTAHLTAVSISDNFLPLLGVHPALGRLLDSRQALTVLLSDEVWRKHFGADPLIVGKGVRINNQNMQIVGVLPANLRIFLPSDAPEQVDVWLPRALTSTRQFRGNAIVARLRRGVTLSQANGELQTLAAQFEREYPDFYSGSKGWQASPFDRGSGATLRFTATTVHDEMTRDARPVLFLLSGAVAFVLVIACVNVANLMLARGSARQRELDIRQALGAGMLRIMRQLLTESLLLAVAATVVGLVGASFGIEAIRRTASHFPLQSRIAFDSWVGWFALLLSLGTTVAFGLLPAWRLSGRVRRTETASASARRLQRMLVVAEVALSIVPLVGGGLMLRSFVNMQRVPLGFEPANVVTASVPLDVKLYENGEKRWAFLRDTLEHIRAIPGVQAASAACPLPLTSQQWRRVGSADQPEAAPIRATQQIAIPGYLAVVGTPLLKGRDFTDADLASGRNSTIVDETLAKRLWPKGDALGKRLFVYRTGWRHDLEVVGITAAVRATDVRDGETPHFMMPDSEYLGKMSFVIKTTQAAGPLMAALQRMPRAYEIRSMDDYVADSIGDTRFVLLILAGFAAASVLMAGVGLYGTLAYLTAQRTREFGIRLALGSSARGVVAIVMRESLLLAVAGIVVGLAGSAACAKAIRNLLYGVQPLDGWTLAGVSGLVGLIALAAAAVPAWRAAQIDPQESLRSE